MEEIDPRRLDWRLTALERAADERSVSERYARFYGSMAVLALVLSFMPLLNDVVIKDDDGYVTSQYDYGTLWEMANDGDGPAFAGVLLMVSLVGMLAYATHQAEKVQSSALPCLIAADAALMFVMLLARPGVPDPEPALAPAGMGGVALCATAAVLGTAHAYELISMRRRRARAS